MRARDREWVVLPESEPDLLILRPLGGSDDETAGILTAIEKVEPATFDLPDPTKPGDHRSAELLRNALRLGFRSSAGPFRSFGHINVEPRPYQLVPMLLALKQIPFGCSSLTTSVSVRPSRRVWWHGSSWTQVMRRA